MTDPGAGGADAVPGWRSFWQRHRARWTLPLVIIVIIGAVAIIDHLGSHRISQVDRPLPSELVPVPGGSSAVALDVPWAGFNPNTPEGAVSSSPTLLSSVLPGAYVVPPKLVPQVDGDLLTSVEITTTTPLTIQYVINSRAVWSDGVPVTAADFIYAWHAQRGDGLDIDGQPYRVASTMGYRDIAKITPSQHDRTFSVVFTTPYTDWRSLFDHLVPAHVAQKVGWNHGFATFDPAVDLSAGPYVLQSVTGDGRAVLVRNRRWWGTPGLLDRITVSVTSNDRSWSSLLADTNVNSVASTSFTLGSLNLVSSLPNTQSEVHPALTFFQLGFNLDSQLFLKASVRQGVAHMIDRPALLAATFGAVAPSAAVSDDHLSVPGVSSYASSSAATSYDLPDVATGDDLLRSAGYRPGPTGQYVDALGRPLVVRLAIEQGDPWIAGVAQLLEGQLSQAGIGVTEVPVEGPTGMAAANLDGSYDLALFTRTASPFLTQTAAWYSSKDSLQTSAVPQNWSNVDDPQINALFAKASVALNPVTGSLAYTQIDDQLWDQMIALPLFGEPGFQANGVQLANAALNPSIDGTLWNVALWSRMAPGPQPKGSATGG